jgi:hypothetical protein
MKEISSEEPGSVPDVGAENAVTESNENKNERGRSQRRRRRVSQSQAKRRMESMFTVVDQKLTAAFIVITVLYVIITIRTYVSLETQSHIDYPQKAIEKNLDEVLDTKEIEPPPKAADTIPDIETLQRTFPVHASGDTELIDHPGIFLANPGQIKTILKEHAGELPADGKMAVPKFWRPTVYGPGGVREFLGNFGEALITPEQASRIGSFHPESGLKTVYISVASYRDPECQPTVEDIFLRAKHPERLRVAIVEQRVEGEDDDIIPFCGKPLEPCSIDPEQAMCKYAHLIDVYVVPAILSVGPVFARHLANRMYRGEYFAMQVDSHVRFIRGT